MDDRLGRHRTLDVFQTFHLVSCTRGAARAILLSHVPGLVWSVLMQIDIKEIKSGLDGHLREQRKRLGCSDAEYWHSAKEKYQIQVPERYFSKNRQVRTCY